LLAGGFAGVRDAVGRWLGVERAAVAGSSVTVGRVEGPVLVAGAADGRLVRRAGAADGVADGAVVFAEVEAAGVEVGGAAAEVASGGAGGRPVRATATATPGYGSSVTSARSTSRTPNQASEIAKAVAPHQIIA